MLSHYMTYSGVLMLVRARPWRGCSSTPSADLAGRGGAGPARRAGLDLTTQRLCRRAVAIAALLAFRNVRLLVSCRRRGDRARRRARVGPRPRALDRRPQQDSNRDRLQMLADGTRDRARPSALRRRAGHDRPGLRPVPAAKSRAHLQPAPAQRAHADRRRARPARAGRVAVVHRRGARRASSVSCGADRRARSPAPASPPSSRCSPPDCSSTTSATRSS